MLVPHPIVAWLGGLITVQVVEKIRDLPNSRIISALMAPEEVDADMYYERGLLHKL